MAKRAPRKPKTKAKPARGARAKDVGFEVEDQSVPSGPQAGLETGLVFVTFIALVVGLVLAQIELSSEFGRGLF